MRQAGAALRLITCEGSMASGDSVAGKTDPDNSGIGARREEARGERSAGHAPADTTGSCDPLQSEGDAVRGVRHDLLKEWMGSHTRILGLWLDRLLEEGDDADLISMIHRQHAWLSMMQVRLDHG
ncbi:MAG: hypothetical protein R3B94_12090 [Hyphomonas sp.]